MRPPSAGFSSGKSKLLPVCFSKRHKKQDRKEEQSFNKTLHSLLLFHVARNNVSATNLIYFECDAEVTIAGMRWAMGDGRWAMGDGRWAPVMGDGRWAMGDER
jgi:hypothetical protein